MKKRSPIPIKHEKKRSRTAGIPPRSSRGKNSGFRRSIGFIMLILCASAASLLLAMRIADENMSPNGLPVIGALYASNSLEDDNSSESRADGRLQLVQLPSILAVFAPSGNPVRPIQSDNMIVDNNDMVAKIYVEKGTDVVSALDGTVKTVSLSDSLGGFLTVSSADDIEITYYGLSDICVERGQPVVQRSILGKAQQDFIRIRITKAGRPVDPFDFFGIKANLG